MKIAVFYENIVTAAEQNQIPMAEMLDQLKAEGLEMLYISGDSLLGREDELLSLFREKRLPIEGLHQHFDFGHEPEDESYQTYIDLAVRAGANNFLMVPGLIRESEQSKRDEVIEHMLRVMKKAVAYGKEKGMAVCMEDFDSMRSPFNSISGLSLFLDKIPELKCAFDTGNFVCYREDEEAAFSVFADKICTVHLKDRSHVPYSKEDGYCVCGDGSFAWPAPVGDGYIRISKILDGLARLGYAGNVIVELYSFHDMLNGIKKSLRWVSDWRSARETSEPR